MPPAPGGTPITGVRIVFAVGPGSAPVEFVWNGAGWARSQNGTPHVDSEGNQIAPENVIVQYTPYANSDTNDQFGVPIREAQTVGRGRGARAHRRRRLHGPLGRSPRPTHRRSTSTRRAPRSGLAPGRTWVELPEPGTTGILP